MKTLKYFIFILALLNINNCGSGGFSGDDTGSGNAANLPMYDIYFCSYIGGANNDSRAGIYGLNRNSTSKATKIIDLAGKIIDSCTVDEKGNLYWGDRSQGAIFKSDSHGNNIRKIVSGLDIPYRGLIVDEKRQRLYWTNWLGHNNPQSGEVSYSDLDGLNKKTIINGLKSGGYLTIDYMHDKLYVSDLFGDSIIKMDMNGSSAKIDIPTDRPDQLVIDSLHSQVLWYDKKAKKMMYKGLSANSADKVLDASQVFNGITEMAYDKKTNSLLFIISENFEQNLYRYNLDNKSKAFITKVPLEVTGLVIAK